MAFSHSLSDPTDLQSLRRFLNAQDKDARLLPLEMLRLEISGDAHLKMSQAADEALAVGGRSGTASVIILTDTSAIMRGDHRLSPLIVSQLNAHDVKVVALDGGNATLHADDVTLDAAAEAAKGADLIVTIGSGTMTDVGKMAALRNGGIPQIVVQTAASVDGFTDNVSVILRNGVKRTVPSRWPTIVLADTTTIGAAPRDLNASGFGEAVSLFTAPADWYLANLVGLDNSFHPASMELLKAAAAEPPDWAGGVAKGEAGAIRELTKLLALRGIVSGVSNTTACLSGVEHVISHMLDLHHAAHHQPIGLHGAQVGVATLVATKLWRRVIEGDLVRPELLKRPDAAKLHARIRKAFGHLDASIAEECLRDCLKKHALIERNWARFESVVETWKQQCAEFDKLVQPPDKLRPALRASGSPATFAELSPAVSLKLARWAVANCFVMRNRFNLVDLLDLMGLWTDEMVDWVMS
jgi:glycerol-1-phosphate dehydrogenase [NAD(P)+]